MNFLPTKCYFLLNCIINKFIKPKTMKNILFFLLLLPFALFSQDAPKTDLFVVLTLDVKNGMEDAFEAAVKAHNTEFHAVAPYTAKLYYNINGPSGGMYSWIMGPMNYTAMDTRPKTDAHDDDWDKVTAMTNSVSSPSYWSMSSKLSQEVVGAPDSKRIIWMYDIKSGQSARWAELVGKVKKVYTEKRPQESIIVAWNEFENTKVGNDVVIIFPFGKWSWMDRESTFGGEFEEVHGPGSWHNFLNDFNSTINGRTDWLRTTIE
ncbi:MAG: hypothetical protein ACI9P5_004475 [Saprospiraceae bacterium]|jgi:hypothetical protein